MFQVNDGDRTLQFEGELLAHATSRRDDSERWVEFDLYRTKGGSYVVARTGRSRLFHAKDCKVVRKRKHQPAQVATLEADSLACSLCHPVVSIDRAHELIYPEQPLYWAQACPTPEAAVESLASYDYDGNRYFTNVARDLITKAAKVDSELGDAYFIETIA